MDAIGENNLDVEVAKGCFLVNNGAARDAGDGVADAEVAGAARHETNPSSSNEIKVRYDPFSVVGGPEVYESLAVISAGEVVAAAVAMEGLITADLLGALSVFVFKALGKEWNAVIFFVDWGGSALDIVVAFVNLHFAAFDLDARAEGALNRTKVEVSGFGVNEDGMAGTIIKLDLVADSGLKGRLGEGAK